MLLKIYVKKNITTFINYGAAEGFHLTGVLKKKLAKMELELK